MARSPLTDPNTPLNQQPAGQTGWGDPVFSDEFDTMPAIDGSKWIPSYPDDGSYLLQSLAGHLSNGHGSSPSDGGADEPQIYDDSAISVSGGVLRLTMTDGVPSKHSGESWYGSYDFTSGMLCTWPAFSLPGGYFEARIRCDAVAGAWPAFWALSASNGLNWPPEIDVLEYWGDSPSWAQFGGYEVGSGQIGTGNHDIDGTMSTWNTFGCLYTPGESVSFYCNGELSGTRSVSFDDDIFLVVNLAGDHRSGMSPSAGDMPFRMEIDWVRAWSFDGEEVEPEPEVGGWRLFDGTPVTPYTLVDGQPVALS